MHARRVAAATAGHDDGAAHNLGEYVYWVRLFNCVNVFHFGVWLLRYKYTEPDRGAQPAGRPAGTRLTQRTPTAQIS
jgi:hypothetical protein